MAFFIILAYLFLVLVAPALSVPLNSPLLDLYDYIIVGGGPAGLTLANRLSEDPSIDVLVLEAGDVDDGSPDIRIPALVGADIFSQYDWGLYTAPQAYLNGQPRFYPLGKALGGGSIINGMLWSRGNRQDYNDWERLGNPGWGWESMLYYFQKSETYTPVYSDEVARQYHIRFNPQVHGFNGPVNVSYPRYFYNASAHLFRALHHLGIPIVHDPNDGLIAGASYLPLDLEPNGQSRSTAREAYYEPYALRENLFVTTSAHVTQLLFEQQGCPDPDAGQPNGDNFQAQKHWPSHHRLFGMDPVGRINSSFDHRKRNANRRLRVIGVEYTQNSTSVRQYVYARREVIVAASAVHCPQILELSGIGDPMILNFFNVSTVIDLPGVGNNLQDHALVGTSYPFQNTSFTYPHELVRNETYNMLATEEYYVNRTGPLTAGPPDGNAFLSLLDISDRAADIISEAASQNVTGFLIPGLDASIVEGYKVQRDLLLHALRHRHRAAYELLNNNEGSLVVSNMRPFSRGTVHIGSPDPFVSPIIDPRYGSNPIDLEVLREALLFNRRILATPSMAVLQPVQNCPPETASDDELIDFIKGGIGTEYHSSGTCAMLPLDKGGVVDPNLLVYGTSNLRVVGTSIIPLLPASHLQAVAYAIGEKAADIIRAADAYKSPVTPETSSGCSTSRA